MYSTYIPALFHGLVRVRNHVGVALIALQQKYLRKKVKRARERNRVAFVVSIRYSPYPERQRAKHNKQRKREAMGRVRKRKKGAAKAEKRGNKKGNCVIYSGEQRGQHSSACSLRR